MLPDPVLTESTCVFAAGDNSTDGTSDVPCTWTRSKSIDVGTCHAREHTIGRREILLWRVVPEMPLNWKERPSKDTARSDHGKNSRGFTGIHYIKNHAGYGPFMGPSQESCTIINDSR